MEVLVGFPYPNGWKNGGFFWLTIVFRSVRVNPDQFYWVRQQSAISEGRETTSPISGRVIPRPPSYAYDDGISYAYNPPPPTGPDPSEVRRVQGY